MVLSRASLSLVSAFTAHVPSHLRRPTTIVAAFGSPRSTNSNRLLRTRRWNTEGAAVERTEEEKAAIKAKREAKK